jgi:hypothetical protein
MPGALGAIGWATDAGAWGAAGWGATAGVAGRGTGMGTADRGMGGRVVMPFFYYKGNNF